MGRIHSYKYKYFNNQGSNDAFVLNSMLLYFIFQANELNSDDWIFLNYKVR